MDRSHQTGYPMGYEHVGCRQGSLPPQFQCQLCQLGNYSRSGLSLQEQQRQASHDKGKSLRRIGSQRTERYHQQLASGRKLQGMKHEKYG